MTAQLSRERLEALSNLQSLECMALPASHAESAAMARMLLAGMDSEPVAVIDKEGNPMTRAECNDDRVFAICCKVGTPLYAAPPAPAIPDHLELIDKGLLMMLERSHQTLLDYRADSVWYWQGDEDDQPEILSCPVIMSAETLRELLAKPAPPAQQPELTVWYGSMPESNGKTNWTAILHRKGEGRCFDGFTIDRSEYPGRVRYAADRVRYLIGEIPERPHLLDYDGDEHSGYAAPPAPVVPEGWEPCSPEWIHRNGACSCGESPRIAFGTTGSHYHPHTWHKPATVAVPDVGEFRIFTQAGGVKVAVKDGKTKNHLFGMGWNACRAAMLKAGSVTAATVPDGLQAYNSAWPSVSITGSVTPPEVQCYLSKMRLEHIKGDWLGAAIALFGSKRPKVRDELVIRNSIIRNCEMPRGNPLFRDCFLPAEWAGKVNAENCCFDEEFNFQPNADVNWLLLNDEISAPEQEV